LIRRLAACLAAFVALAVLAVVVLVHALDRPWLKRRLQALAHDSAGIDVDCDAAKLRLLSGLTLDGVVVRSPPELRTLAPELVRVGHVEVTWSVGSLRGIGPAIERLTVSIRDLRSAGGKPLGL
jgi:hypothetical protein